MERQTSSSSRLRERSRKLESNARSIVSEVDEMISDAEDLVRGHLESQPYTTLALAAGAGFVIGGGLTVGVLATLARVGARVAVGAAIQGALARVLSEIKPIESPT